MNVFEKVNFSKFPAFLRKHAFLFVFSGYKNQGLYFFGFPRMILTVGI